MNYALAQKLKEAGFGNYIDGVIDDKTGEIITDIWMPTLSQLIEKCGERFGILERFSHSGKFGAYVPRDIGTSGTGDSPEEAVANLWLELNKK